MKALLANNAQRWLAGTGREVFASQIWIFALRLLQLTAQIAAFWYFALLMQTIVVDEKDLKVGALLPFMTSAACWALFAFVSDMIATYTKDAFEQTLEKRVHSALKSQQTALTRRFSLAYWQQLLLENLNDIATYHTQYSVQKWLSLSAPIIVLTVIFPINYIVGAALLLTMPVVPLFMILVGKGAANLHQKHFIALERLGNMFSDRLKALALITASNQHQTQVKRLQDASNIVNRKTMQVVSVAFLSSTVLDFFSTISIALVAVFIGFSLIGEFSFGPVITLNLGLFMLLVSPLLFSELKTLGRYYHQKAKAEASAERFVNVLSAKVEAVTKSAFSELTWLNYQVSAGSSVVNAKKLHLCKHDWVLLTGNSGAGKTLLLEGLMGFRQASHAFSSPCTLLGQKPVILDTTLFHNLSLAREDISAQEMLRAINDVQLCDWFMSLPHGLQTVMDDFPKLSGGEAQRLALARVLLQQHEVVLLDEPTAHLTSEQHALISELVHDKLKDRTVIWVSHKTLPSTWFNQHWHIEKQDLENVL